MRMSRTFNADKRYYLDEKNIVNAGALIETIKRFNDMKSSLYNAMYDDKYLNAGNLASVTCSAWLKERFGTNDYYNCAVYTYASAIMASQREVRQLNIETLRASMEARSRKMEQLEEKLGHKLKIKESLVRYAKTGKWKTPYKGCMSSNYVNAQNIRSCKPNAFQGSAIQMLDKPLFKLGPNLLMLRRCDVIDLDDRNEPIDKIHSDKENRVRKVIMHNKNSFAGVARGSLHVDIIDIRDEDMTFGGNHYNINSQIVINTKRYRTIDGIVYTSDMKELVFCDPNLRGDIIIPDGVERIRSQAFIDSCANSVRIPDSVKEILVGAFQDCSFTYLNLGEGVQTIHDGAFVRCSYLKELRLPSSLRYIGRNNHFTAVDKIHTETVPYGLPMLVFQGENPDYEDGRDGSLIIELWINDKAYYLPKYVDATADLNEYVYTSLKFGLGGLSKIYEHIKLLEIKQETALLLYDRTHDPDIEKYIRRTSLNIAKRYINNKHEQKLVDFLKRGTLKTASLNSLLQTARTHRLTSIEAYILQALENSKKKTSFRL